MATKRFVAEISEKDHSFIKGWVGRNNSSFKKLVEEIIQSKRGSKHGKESRL